MKLIDKLKIHSNTSKTLPTALESEMYVLGAVMLLEGAVQSVFEHLRHWHFYFDKNVVIWKAVTRLIKKDKSITKDLLFMELHKKAHFEGVIEIGYLQQCIDSIDAGSTGIVTVTKGALNCHKEEIIETWSRRRMIDLGHTIQYWGFLPGGHCSKQFAAFERRKRRIEAIQENVINADDDCYEFDPNDPIEMPDYTLTLEMEGKQYGLAEQGCIVHISGGTGVRKTTLLTALIASSFRDRMIGFKFERRGIILFFDTEQPKKRFKHVQRRIYNMCGRKNTKEYYRSFSLRRKSPIERIKFIDKTIRQQKGPIAAIIIDGTLDLVNSMNDVEECTKAMQKIMTWTEETNAIAFCILHDTSSNSNKMAGWLGSISERKQDTEMNLTFAEDPDYSQITFRKTRGTRKPRSFEFTQDANGWPVLADVVEQNNDYYEDVPF